MASLRQRGKAHAWYALFRDGTGKLREKPTHTTDRKKAQSLADEWERTARPKTNERTALNMRRVMADLHREILGREMLRLSIKDGVERWLGSREKEVSKSTAFIYRHSLEGLVKHLGEGAKADLFTLTREDVIGFRDAIGAVRSARTANHRVRIVRMWLKCMKADGWTTENVAEGIKPLKQRAAEKTTRRPFTVPELRLILAKALEVDPEWHAMILRGYYTGQRLGDIASMREGDEDPLVGQVTMVTGKTGRRVIIEMHPAYIDFVLSQESSDDPTARLHPKAFASQTKNKGRVVTLCEQFAQILIACGLRTTTPGTAGAKTFYPLSFHSLRHTFVSHLQDAGVTRSVVQDIVGQSEAVNVGYTHLDRETKRGAVAKLPNILQG